MKQCRKTKPNPKRPPKLRRWMLRKMPYYMRIGYLRVYAMGVIQ